MEIRASGIPVPIEFQTRIEQKSSADTASADPIVAKKIQPIDIEKCMMGPDELKSFYMMINGHGVRAVSNGGTLGTMVNKRA